MRKLELGKIGLTLPRVRVLTLLFSIPASETLHALGHYLFPKDVVGLLKRSYSDSDKDDIAEDGDVLESFFGSAEEGNKIIVSVALSKWDAM